MPKRIRETINILPRTHYLAVLAAGVLLSAALVLSPSKTAEANRISFDLPKYEKTNSDSHPAGNQINRGASFTHSAKYSPPPLNRAKNQKHTSSIELTVQDLEAPTTIEAFNIYSRPTPKFGGSHLASSREWTSHKVKSGDSLSLIFRRAKVDQVILAKLLKQVKDKDWTRIYPGQDLEFAKDQSGAFAALKITKSQLEHWIIEENDQQQFKLEKFKKSPDIHSAYAEGTITSSLFTDAAKAGLPDSLIMQLANIFGWDIDFVLDIRSSDSFKVVYEQHFLDGKKIGLGNIIAAEFINQGQQHLAVRYENQLSKAGYYSPNGESLKKAFLRSPIDFARISSHFSLRRKHPVLHKIRAHRGTDYAARRGTPIKATGDGKIIFVGRKGGYGKAIILRHAQSMTTLYAHMSKFARGIRNGKRVNQGQIIGYVGSTGLASGPHLHYEFRVNGVHKNPVTVKFPHAEPVAKKEMSAFKEAANLAMSRLETYAQSYQVALINGKPNTP